MGRAYRAIMLAFASTILAGCVGNGDGETELTDAVTRGATEGPVRLALTAGPKTLDLNQHLTVRLDIIADKGVTIADVPYETALAEGDGRFELRLIRASREKPQPTDDGKVRWRYAYEIEFVLPGEHELPGAAATFVPLPDPQGGEAAPAEAQTISTTPFTVVVGDEATAPLDPEELANIKRLAPVELPSQWHRWWWALPVGVLVVLLLLSLAARRKRRVEAATVVIIPAHEWARREFATLVAEDLIAHARIQEFYYRVSWIVRGYIERRFAVAAPEMTTEEFLTTAVTDRRFDSHTTNELDRFLVACDLVKYARHEPGQAESLGMLDAATGFVEKTRARGHDESDAGSTGEGHPATENAA